MSEKNCKRIVQPANELRAGAEVRFQLNGFECQRFAIRQFESHLLYAREQFGVCIAEEIDGLHGVADDKEGTARGIGPCRDESADEAVLAAAGVLELVNQQVTDSVGDTERGFAGQAVFVFENAKRDLGRSR